jgi:hypothetical protein
MYTDPLPRLVTIVTILVALPPMGGITSPEMYPVPNGGTEFAFVDATVHPQLVTTPLTLRRLAWLFTNATVNDLLPLIGMTPKLRIPTKVITRSD